MNCLSKDAKANINNQKLLINGLYIVENETISFIFDIRRLGS